MHLVGVALWGRGVYVRGGAGRGVFEGWDVAGRKGGAGCGGAGLNTGLTV